MALIPAPPEALAWLRRLARARDMEDSWDETEPYPAWEEFLSVGMIEYRPAAFRLSEIGWWMLSRLVAEDKDDA